MPEPMEFFTDTRVCIGCKACEVACKEWNQLPAENGGIRELSGDSYDNTRRLDGLHWRHVRFIEQFKGPYDGRWLMMSDVCKHCVQAGCLEVCPTGAIIRTEFDTVVIQSDVCTAAVADVGLDHDGVEFGADDGARGTHLEAARLDAVLAHVAHHQPAAVVGTLELLDEAHVPPVQAVQPAGVVVAVAAQLPDPAVLGWQLVPFLARHFARLAADAHPGVGEEFHGLGHIKPSPRCRRTPFPRGSTPSYHRPTT